MGSGGLYIPGWKSTALMLYIKHPCFSTPAVWNAHHNLHEVDRLLWRASVVVQHSYLKAVVLSRRGPCLRNESELLKWKWAAQMKVSCSSETTSACMSNAWCLICRWAAFWWLGPRWQRKSGYRLKFVTPRAAARSQQQAALGAINRSDLHLYHGCAFHEKHKYVRGGIGNGLQAIVK